MKLRVTVQPYSTFKWIWKIEKFDPAWQEWEIAECGFSRTQSEAKTDVRTCIEYLKYNVDKTSSWKIEI